jgi:hypothetical protein
MGKMQLLPGAALIQTASHPEPLFVQGSGSGETLELREILKLVTQGMLEIDMLARV